MLLDDHKSNKIFKLSVVLEITMRVCRAIHTHTQPINELFYRIFIKSFKWTYTAAGLLWTRRNLGLRIRMLYL